MMIGLTASVFTRLLTMIGGSCLLIRGFVPYGTWPRDGRHSKGEPVIAGSPLLCCVACQMMGSEMPLIFW